MGQERLGRSNYRPSSPCTEFILVAKIIALDRLKTLWLCTASARYWYYLLLKNKNLINSTSKETCIKALNNTCVFLLNFLITEILLGGSKEVSIQNLWILYCICYKGQIEGKLLKET